MNVDGARILVIGGVRRLGRSLALDLAEHGAAICVSSRTSGPEAAATVESLMAAGATAAHAIAGDVRRPEAAAELIRRAAAALDGIDGLLFAASGPFIPCAPQDIDEISWDASFDTIAKGFFYTACAARDEFLRATARETASPGRGCAGVIVVLTDYLGLQPWSTFAAHGAAKAAQIHLVKELARAWAGDGVRVCGVAPGPVDLEDDEHRAATLRAAARAASPRLVAASDVGRAVRFCFETDGTTGINIPVDNGSLLTS